MFVNNYDDAMGELAATIGGKCQNISEEMRMGIAKMLLDHVEKRACESCDGDAYISLYKNEVPCMESTMSFFGIKVSVVYKIHDDAEQGYGLSLKYYVIEQEPLNYL